MREYLVRKAEEYKCAVSSDDMLKIMLECEAKKQALIGWRVEEYGTKRKGLVLEVLEFDFALVKFDYTKNAEPNPRAVALSDIVMLEDTKAKNMERDNER